MNAWLEAAGGVRVPLHGVCSIGRAPGNTLVVDDHRVSRRHALIHAQASDGFHIVDLGSSNGVVLNGRSIKQPVLLRDGDQISIADTLFVFRAKPQAVSDSATSDQTIFMSRDQLPRKVLWLVAAELDRVAADRSPRTVDPARAGQWLLAMKEILEKGGGLVYRFSGQGFIGHWLDPEVSPVAILQVIKSFRQSQLNASAPFHLAFHHGEISIDAGDGEAEPVLLGSGMILLSRLEKWTASSGKQLVLSAEAASALRVPGELSNLGSHTLPGTSNSVELFGLQA